MRTFFAIITLLVSLSAHTEPYVLAGAGLATTDAASTRQTGAPAFAGFGFRVNPSVAIEASYLNLDIGDNHTDQSSISAPLAGGGTTITNSKREWTGKGVGLFAVGMHPLSPAVSLVGKVGIYRLKSETKISTSVANFPTVGANSLTQTNTTMSTNISAPAIAVGLQEKMGDHATVRAMIEHIACNKDDFRSSTSLTLSVLYAF